MTNGELIEKLRQYPENARVIYTNISPIGEDCKIDPDPFFNEISNEIYL